MFDLCGKGKNVWKLLTGSTEMETLVGLFVMLLGVSHGVETNCDARQNGAQCYGALGGTVSLRLMDSTSEIFRYQLYNKTNTTLTGRYNSITFNKVSDRFSFTPSNGTFRISELSRTDGGEYSLKTFGSNGLFLEELTLQLTIQAPVSSVLLVPECLSQGEMKVTCSSEGGDSPQYSWTLDGHTLTHTELLSEDTETTSITLKQQTSGQLVCSVRNGVSSVSKQTQISDCGFIFIECTLLNGTEISKWVFEANNTLLCIKSTTPAGKETTVSISPCTNNTSSNQTATQSSEEPWDIRNLSIIAGVLSSLVLLLLVGVAVICTHKKRNNNSKPNEEDDQELTYADVRVKPRPGVQVQQREETVEYGQIKFSRSPPHNVQPADECVYSMVRKGR